MSKACLGCDKYFPHELHQEIDLDDRRLAYLDKSVEFASSMDRKEAKSRMLAKGSLLEKTALELAKSAASTPAEFIRSP